MKSNPEKRFQTKVMVNILYSLVLSIVLETLIIGNLSFFTKFGIIQQAGRGSVSQGPDVVLILILVVLGIGIFTFFFWLLQRRSFQYIEEILQAIRAISAGDFNEEVDVQGDNEFSEMASQLNKMTRDIRILMEKERSAEQSKNELITNIAHDLRTPLTSIIGYLDLIKNKPLGEEQKQEYIRVVYQKSKKLEKLIEDLFGFTKTGSGKLAMHVEKVDIVKLLSQLMDEFYPTFAKNGIAFDLNTNVNTLEINGDGSLLARLFDNLINNAIKYGAEGKKIDVRISHQQGDVSVSVVNYGKVIPQEELPYIFEKFYRVEQSRSSNTGGTGLGLAIAKNITQLHHGTIQVKSDLGGTAFIVTLPVNLDIERENFTDV